MQLFDGFDYNVYDHLSSITQSLANIVQANLPILWLLDRNESVGQQQLRFVQGGYAGYGFKRQL